MTRQAGTGRGVPSGQNSSTRAGRNSSVGAAVLDRPATDASADASDRLREEMRRLVEASRAGRLSERGRAEQFEGNNRKLVEDVKAILDAILLPIGEGSRVPAQIGAGKVDELITQTWSGDHEKMKQAVNNMAVVLQGLRKEIVRLTEASREGQLSERGRAEVRGNSMLSRTPIPEIHPDNYRFLQEHVYSHAGIVLEEDKHYLFESRLEPIVRHLGLGSINDLCALIRATRETEAGRQVVEAMTTNETCFFRDPAHYDAIRTVLLPRLKEERRDTRTLRFWSAAASTGQEAFSLAMILLEGGLS